MNIVFEKVEGTISETSYNIRIPFISGKIPNTSTNAKRNNIQHFQI